MLNKLNELSFVIGLFFVIMSLILFANLVITGASGALSLLSSSAFLVFGLLMMLGGKKAEN